MPSGIVARFAFDRHCSLRLNRGRVKEGSVMLAALETVAKTDPIRPSGRHDANVAAEAAAGESFHRRLLLAQLLQSLVAQGPR